MHTIYTTYARADLVMHRSQFHYGQGDWCGQSTHASGCTPTARTSHELSCRKASHALTMAALAGRSATGSCHLDLPKFGEKPDDDKQDAWARDCANALTLLCVAACSGPVRAQGPGPDATTPVAGQWSQEGLEGDECVRERSRIEAPSLIHQASAYRELAHAVDGIHPDQHPFTQMECDE